ncbi:nucleoside deaminase [Nocardioides sp. GXZ039]|uniref:nucleoside deaminase n=1 Tax=Nocardioides sp. GXZ039 TaxID=3136018 RepID=UPI0030F3AEED
MIDDADLTYLRRCADLAEQALEGGNGPFGSLVVLDGEVRFEDHNRETETGDATRHPEFEIARWAAGALTPEERDRAVVYTSGEHCAMCSAAHAWVGLGRIVYAVSSAQLDRWRAEWGLDAAPVTTLAIGQVAPGVAVDGPAPALEDRMRELHRRSSRS